MNDDRTQWLEERRKGIGASDSAAALGLSRWRTPLQLYLDKIGEGEAQEETDPMRFGTLLEPIVRAEFVRRTGMQVVFGQPPVVSDAYPWMRCNLDGWIPGGRRVFEAKTARSDAGWGPEGGDDIPQDYILQCHHAMIVTGAQLAELAVLIAGSDFRAYTIERDPELCELVIDGEREFWDAVQRREPPEPITLAEINLRWRQSRPVAVELSPDAAAACARLREIRDGMATLKAEGELCESIVKSEMTDCDTATIGGQIAVTWRQAKSSRAFDAKSFRAAHPDVAEKYMTENPGSRRFLIKESRNAE